MICQVNREKQASCEELNDLVTKYEKIKKIIKMGYHVFRRLQKLKKK